MMIMDQKKAIASIMSKRRSANGQDQGSAPMKSESVKDTDGELDPRHMAAQDMLMALHEKSPMKLAEALANFVDLHSMRQGEDESDESYPAQE